MTRCSVVCVAVCAAVCVAVCVAVCAAVWVAVCVAVRVAVCVAVCSYCLQLHLNGLVHVRYIVSMIVVLIVQCTASVLQCVAERCSGFQRVAVGLLIL